jgi:hypothetical protein
MLRLFGQVAVLAAKRAVRSWLAALSILIYALVFVAAARLMVPFGLVGGFAVGFLGAACFGGYLSLLADAVSGKPLRFGDIKHGMRAVWDVISVFFALMIIGFGVSLLQKAAGPNAPAVGAIAQLAGAFFLNVVPELIYNSRSRSFALLKESANFALENPVAWFLPNLVFALVLLGVTGSLSFSFSSPALFLIELSRLGSVSGILGILGGAPLWAAPLLIAFVHFVMVFRGLLYQELVSGSSRMRAFRRRMDT